MKRQVMGREVVVAITGANSTSAPGSKSSTASSTAAAETGADQDHWRITAPMRQQRKAYALLILASISLSLSNGAPEGIQIPDLCLRRLLSTLMPSGEAATSRTISAKRPAARPLARTFWWTMEDLNCEPLPDCARRWSARSG